ncbi:hypothetical protein ANSO36C_56200 [Nostoc cf. commune SO-36]|uniref:Uncharacterized protein n=1 Tax=Nostoc cf. commune SO-36 TaxID=449208 RepID=A0ABM7Z9C5_NOSCO|nr:hypothetical protein ANSO36C_56200 [Nostoc cf. commune SO-36]
MATCFSIQDYQLQKGIAVKPSQKEQITVDIYPKNELKIKLESAVSATIIGLSHKELQTLTDYSLTTIRSKASQQKSVTTKDGVTYRYNKNPEVLKWVIY